MISIKRALISVYDKEGVGDLAAGLSSMGVELISTGGTAGLLRELGLSVTSVSDLTGFPEILDGRVKTLTPQIHGAILARRDKEDHLRQIADHGIRGIDMVVVNLYPFLEVIRKPDVTLEEAIENIDIGGPSMVRSAGKNHRDVVVVTDPADYPEILGLMKANNGSLPRSFSFDCARKAFALTSAYDAAITRYMGSVEEAHQGTAAPEGDDPFPERLHLSLRRLSKLRYGENPQQQAALYEAPPWLAPGLAQAELLHGKPLSFNNLLDLESARAIVSDFEETAVSIIKHTNPCGTAVGPSVAEAYERALEADPVSAFGGIVGSNRPVDAAAAEAITKLFLEAVIAPDFEEDALEILGRKKNLRLLRLSGLAGAGSGSEVDLRTISGGLLLQEADPPDHFDIHDLEIAGNRKPTEAEYRAMAFSWKVIRHLKSNAVLFSSEDRLLSAGFGQTSRVVAVKLARQRSVLPLEGSVLASDAFFPFRDGLDLAADAGATAVIQPGGSIRDEDVIAAADERGLAMVFTGKRHFKH